MESFDSIENLIKNRDEKKKKKFSNKIIIILCTIISIFIIFIFIYKNNQIKENQKLLKDEKQKNDDLKQIIDKVNKQNNQTNITLNELIKWKQKKQEELKNKSIEYEINSNIINKKKEIKLIIDRLTNEKILKNKNIIFNLIYRASRDGFGASKYHRKCDGKINTLCVVETDKGCKFGGYTETKIQNTYKNFKDPNSFLFSLNTMKIYENMNKEGNVIRHHGI